MQLLEEVCTARNETSHQRDQAERARTEEMKAQLKLQTLASVETDLRKLRADFEEQRQACVNAERTAAVLAAQKTDLEQRLVKRKSAKRQAANKEANGQSGADRHERVPRSPREADRKAASTDSQRAKQTRNEATSVESKSDALQQPKPFLTVALPGLLWIFPG
ncbi:hypothetical protein [Massilia sp. TWP1-3-3]|uniref:hypothetical protein n=1 Tax=Massilia sp. TWP1-3-3 TaxID=2804573 RepID=UPI003CF5416A